MRTENPKMIYFVLWVLCILGSISVFPYIYYLGVPVPSISALLLSILQVMVLYGGVCTASYYLVPKTDLRPFAMGDIVKPGVLAGGATGALILMIDRLVFSNSMLSEIEVPVWAGVLASVYGAVNEEVLLRLFLFTSVYYLFGKIFTIHSKNRIRFLWSSNLIVALLFGIGHLPLALQLAEPSAFEVVRILLLNGIPGLIFGWLYFSNSLWVAMVAHFITDLTIHGIMG